MTDTTKVTEPLEDVESHLQRSRQMYEHMTQQMALLIEQLSTGDLGAAPESTKILRELEKAQNTFLGAEARFYDQKKHVSGQDAGPSELDLASARTEIGCRMAKLRRSRCPKGLPR